MNEMDPRQQYRALKQQQKFWNEKRVNAEQDLLMSAKHPEYYTGIILDEIREDAATATAKTRAVTEQMAVLEKDPAVRQMLLRDLGMASGAMTYEPMLHAFDDIEEKKVPWLWYPFIPLGRITMLEGDPGQGKSWFSLAVATCVSLGIWMELRPEEESWSQPAGVLYVTCEDDPEDTIKKRLRILQADQTKIYHLSGKAKANTKEVSITLADLPILAQAIDTTQAKLIIIDPIQAYLPPGSDMNKAEQIRPMLAKLQRLASEKNVAVLIVRHLAKGNKDNALYRGMGSIDFTASARSVLFCGERKDMQEMSSTGAFTRRFGVVQIKNNISARGPAVEFSLQQDSFLWIGTSSDLTAEQLLAPPVADGGKQIGAKEKQEATAFLLTSLQGGKNRDDVQKEARKLGIAPMSLLSAKVTLKVEERRDGTGWSWFLPGKYVSH